MVIENIEKKAFSLAEMMVVMLILSIVMAASMPIITKRSKTGGDSIWHYMANKIDIYSAQENNQRAALGTNSFAGAENARLLINTSATTQNQISFKETGTQYGKLVVNSSHNVGLGTINLSNTYATAIGHGANATNDFATALGTTTIASGSYCTALGYGSKATGTQSTAIGIGNFGGNCGASYDYSIAIGASASAYANDAVAIGAASSAASIYNTALGANAIASYNYATALGAGSTATSSDYALAVGYGSAVTSSSYPGAKYSIAIGYDAKVTNLAGSVAIGTDSTGNGATADAANHIVLGTANHYVVIPGHLTVAGWGTVPSDRRLKNVGEKFSDGLDKIRQIQTYNFTFKKDKKKSPRVGVIAQDLQKIFPHAIEKGGDGYLLMRQEDMFYAMINSIKQLDKIVQGIIKDFKLFTIRLQKIEEKVIALAKFDQSTDKKIKLLEAKNKQLEARLKILESKK